LYDLTKFPDIKNHLDHISPTLDEVGDHYVICCPYCDDAIRKQIIDHGHCYVSKNIPVFYCHRCDTTGTILDLLNITEYNNTEVINQLKQIVQFKIGKNYLKTNTSKHKSKIIIDDYIANSIKQLDNDQLDTYYKYLNSRIGYVDYNKYLLFPCIINNQLTVGFMNYNGYVISYRFIYVINDIRYKKESDQYYYFQDISEINNYKNIIICEGQFDLISLNLYNNNNKDSFFICANGKNYVNCVKELVYNYLYLNSSIIHIVFDNDTKYNWQKNIIRKLNIVVNNTDNTIKSWKPKYLKDSNACSELIELQDFNFKKKNHNFNN